MAGISGLNPYGTYNLIYKPNSRGTFGLTGANADRFQQLDTLFNNLKLIANYTDSQTASRQSSYRTQIKDFAAGAKNLAAGADSRRNLDATAGTAKKIAVVTDFADKFTRLADTLGKADNLTADGRELMNSLKAAASVREDELKAIGIAYDKDTGALTVDEAKLNKAVETDYGKVQETLTGSSGLAASVDKTIGAAVKESVSEYFAAPAAKSADYTKLLGGLKANAYYGAYSQGLLLDLLA